MTLLTTTGHLSLIHIWYTYKQQVGAVTLAEAREKAQKIREDILEGRDPRAGVSQEVKSDKPAEHTLDELFPKYLDVYKRQGYR